MDNLFQGFKEEPPLNKNNPPTAGAIYWDRSLFHRIKHTIIRFTSLEDMMTTEMGKAVIVAFFCISHLLQISLPLTSDSVIMYNFFFS